MATEDRLARMRERLRWQPEVLQREWSRLLETVAAAPEDEEILGRIAAGPLEGFLGLFDDQAIDLVEQESARNERFRRLLTGVWRHGMSDEVWARIQAIQAKVTNPLE